MLIYRTFKNTAELNVLGYSLRALGGDLSNAGNPDSPGIMLFAVLRTNWITLNLPHNKISERNKLLKSNLY